MDIYMQYYDFIIDSLSETLVMYVPVLPGKWRLPQIVWRITIILFFWQRHICLSLKWIRLDLV